MPAGIASATPAEFQLVATTTEAAVPPTAPLVPTTATAAAPIGPTTQFVARSGATLTLGGAPYRFTGLNIYNANSRDNCWYSLGHADGRLDAGLASIGAGQEVFRAWFFQSLATTSGVRDWSAFDHTLAVAKARGVRVIATLANQWGDCEEQPAGVYKTDSWYASGYRTVVRSGTVDYRSWVAEIAARYRDDPTVMAWELMNEPENKVDTTGPCGAPETLRSWADDVSTLIKAVDPNHLVAVGTIGSGQCGAQEDAYRALHALPAIDLCSYHDYDLPQAAMPGDQWNGLQVRLDQCATIGRPLFVGETGLGSAGADTLAARATAFDRKFAAEFAAGAVGILMWSWRDEGLSTGYDIGPLDPALALLAAY
jgi:endo-1,4-beta-mannosidase